MSNSLPPIDPFRSPDKPEHEDLVSLLSQKLVGQDAAIKAIVPYVYMYQSSLAPAGRPAGVFLLLGPTGTGKTRTVEAIAELLHGSAKKIVKIDCGEFQMEHETAKLIGAPPGYLGHRETTPMLTQQQIIEATSEQCDLSLVLFDEIEKAAQSMTKLLLGILDKGLLRLGDNSIVNFEKCLIFFTSNLGAREMMKEINPDIGFQSAAKPRADLSSKLESIALGAVRKRFSPEFVNRIDAVVTYQPLDAESLEAIVDHDIRALQDHVNSRLNDRCFAIEVAPEARAFLLQRGFSEEYGARELKRTIHRELTQPLATMVTRSEIPAGGQAKVTVSEDGQKLVITAHGEQIVKTARPTILIADDNHDLVLFLAIQLKEEHWDLVTSEDAETAWELFLAYRPGVVLLDYVLGCDDGLRLGLAFQAKAPGTQIIMMTGGGLSEEELAVCRAHDFPVLFKPFLAEDLMTLIRGRHRRNVSFSAAGV